MSEHFHVRTPDLFKLRQCGSAQRVASSFVAPPTNPVMKLNTTNLAAFGNLPSPLDLPLPLLEAPIVQTAQRRCHYCGSTSTPMWRHGPGEYVNLCNSCGVKWRRGKILQSTKYRHPLCKDKPKVRADKAPRSTKKVVRSPLTPIHSPMRQKESCQEKVREFAMLLGSLAPEKVSQFCCILTSKSNDKMLQFSRGEQVHMSVDMIDGDTWLQLRAMAHVSDSITNMD